MTCPEYCPTVWKEWRECRFVLELRRKDNTPPPPPTLYTTFAVVLCATCG